MVRHSRWSVLPSLWVVHVQGSLGDRLMAGHLALNREVKVQILLPEPFRDERVLNRRCGGACAGTGWRL